MSKFWDLLVKAIAPSIVTWLKDLVTGWVSKVYHKATKYFKNQKIDESQKTQANRVEDITQKIYDLEASITDEMSSVDKKVVLRKIKELENELRIASRELNNLDD